MSDPLILVDVMNCAFRNGFAHQLLTDEEGNLTGAQYGVLKTIHDLRESVSKRIVFCWDHGVPVPGAARPRNWRDNYISTYKANRPKTPNDIHQKILGQLPALYEALNYLGYPSISVMGLEADDVIGLLSRCLPGKLLIFSTDKDFYQLLNDRVWVLVPKKDKGEFQRISPRDVEQQYGVPVNRWAEYLALGGDTSDNIKPLRGMGPKTATKLIQAGCALTIPFNNHHSAFIQKFEKYSVAWSDILRSYDCARIPTHFDDHRITHLLPDGFQETVRRLDGTQQWKDGKHCLVCQRKFEQFCADRNMHTILAHRNKLFSGESSPCQPTVAVPPPVMKKVKMRSLFDT